jgi:hypothetical protein
MTDVPPKNWVDCTTAPDVGSTIRWREPIWDVPTKARGKRDQIGEQMVTATLLALDEPAELKVITVETLSRIDGARDMPSKMKKDDIIRRKISSIKSGACQQLVQEE